MSELLPIIIGGEERNGTGPIVESVSPIDGTTIARIAGASPEDVDAAVRAGHAAMHDPAWQNLLPHERARLLVRAADLLEGDLERLAQLQTRDNGKPITETRALVGSAAGTFRYVAASLETADELMPTSRGPYFTMSVYEPIGVVGAITPWNSPIASEAQKLAPALAAGNAVILKPAAWTPLLALELGRILLRAGFPPGLISVTPGPGSSTGQAIIEHPLVKRISFTGGTSTGRAIAHVAADKLMDVSLELGGKSPTIICEDADLDHAIAGVLYGIFSSQGQACIAGSRLFVHRSHYDRIVEELVERANRIRVGDPRDERTRMGPLVSASHREAVDSYVRLAESEGGTVLCGGRIPAGQDPESGYYYSPTVIGGLTNTARVCQEEIFGPVLVVIPFDDEDDLVDQANDSLYGLACGIWTSDYRRAWRIARRIETGTVWINTYKLFSSAAPFGGVKESGLGREKGRDWIRAYQAQKTLYWGTNDAPIPWAPLPGSP